jgi:Ca-activated chloride channel family protein
MIVHRPWILSLLMLLVAAKPAQTAEPSRTLMIVHDGSGSMWGRLDGDKTSKLQSVRDALRRALSQAPPSTSVGLSSFGHRRKGDCGDVETIVAPEPLEIDKLMAPVERLNPKGKGPLVLAIREAAKSIADTGRSAIVLIHDGPDNCQQDACAAAAEIAKAQPGLKIHTVGLALEAEDVRKMACIAAQTGGKSFDARDAAQIDAALFEAIRLAAIDPGLERKIESPAPTARPAPVAGTRTEAATALPGLDVTAALNSAGAAIDAPIRWRVLKSDGREPPLYETDAARLARPLATGKYVVEARLGLASARQRIDVDDKPAAPNRITLDAGVITPAARANKDGGIIEGATYSIRAVKPGAPTTASGTLWIGRAGGSDIVLPAGTYIVRAEHGLAVKEETVALAAGTRKGLDLVLGSGRLDLAVALSEDGPPLDRAVYIISEDDPDSPQGRREVTRSAAATPELILPAGTYYVTVRAAGAEVRQRIAVGAGDIVKRTIALGLARLSVGTRRDNGTPAGQPPPLLTRVLRADGDGGEVARSAAADPQFLLPAGRYRVQVQAGSQNVRIERTVDVKAREAMRLDIPIEAAQIVLKLRDGSPTAIDQFWEVRDAGGRVVWRTTQSEARMMLAPGRYTAQVEWRGRRLERSFEAQRGAAATVTVGTE